jgi:hypothetical protein
LVRSAESLNRLFVAHPLAIDRGAVALLDGRKIELTSVEQDRGRTVLSVLRPNPRARSAAAHRSCRTD